MKKIFLLLYLFISLFCNAAIAEAIDVSAKSAVVIDAYSKKILYEKDCYTKRGMASTTKIMTGLVAIEHLNLDDIVSVSSYAASTEGSSIWLSPGENISVGDLLYGLMLASGNDAATALAEHTSGSVESFTLLMNSRAKQIGALNTNFTNPHGLPDPNHYTTAYDLALISAEAMENEVFSEIVKTKNKTISWEGSEWNRSLSNHNKLLKMYDYSIGIKTGFTKKDGRCLVSCSEKNGQRFIIVTLSAPDDWNDHINLSEYCFSEFLPHRVCSKGEKAGILINRSIDADDITIIYSNDYITTLPAFQDGDIIKKFSFDTDFPVKKGDKIGVCSISYLGEEIGRVNLIAGNDSYIRKNFMNVIKQLTKGIIKQ